MAEAAAAAVPRPVVLIQVEDLVASDSQGQIAPKALDYGDTLREVKMLNVASQSWSSLDERPDELHVAIARA